MDQCQGQTKKGTPCMWKGKYDGYCKWHKKSSKPSESCSKLAEVDEQFLVLRLDSSLIKALDALLSDIKQLFLGKKGEIIFDTQICEHNIFLEKITSEDIKKQIFIIGKKDSYITESQIEEAFQKIKNYASDPRFDNGRSYFYEGIKLDNERSEYYIHWGS